jgi:hypothetical protein
MASSIDAQDVDMAVTFIGTRCDGDTWDVRVASKQASLTTALPSGSDALILMQAEPCRVCRFHGM